MKGKQWLLLKRYSSVFLNSTLEGTQCINQVPTQQVLSIGSTMRLSVLGCIYAAQKKMIHKALESWDLSSLLENMTLLSVWR